MFRRFQCRPLVRGVAPLLVAFLILIPLAKGENTPLPDLGDTSGAVISPFQERKMGEDLMRQFRRQMNFLDDPELQDYLQALGDRIASQSDHIQHPFSFSIVKNPVLNAFAIPGGFITIHTGLVINTETEGQLASVLAHEIAHITQRHIPRMLANQGQDMGAAMLSVLAALVLMQAGEIQGGEAALALGTAGLIQRQLNFTRSHEEEADRVGIQLLDKAGFDARAMPEFFGKLMTWSRIYDTDLPEFLQTHPLTTRRIAESADRAQGYPRRPLEKTSAFHHFRAKIRALTPDDTKSTVDMFESTLKSGRYADKKAEQYGYAIALTRAKQYDKARNVLLGLRKANPASIQYRVALARLEMAAGRPQTGLKLFASAYREAPTHRAVQQEYADSLIQAGQHDKASEILRKAIRQRPEEPVLHKMRAVSEGNSGRKTEAHQSMAEYHYWRGEHTNAIRQLELAMTYAGDNAYLKAALEARIREIRDEIKRTTVSK